VSALQTAATHCPVIGKALALQQSKRNYVTKTPKVAMAPTHPGLAESASLAETHRAAGVSDLSQGTIPLCLPRQKLIQGTCPHFEAARKAHGLNFEQPKAFDYEAFYGNELEKKHKDKSYRYFNNINRVWASSEM
jgi:5-aminolevulinate synthase